jgi:hypothetical protein
VIAYVTLEQSGTTETCPGEVPKWDMMAMRMPTQIRHERGHPGY